MLFEMRAERNSCARNITLDWIGLDLIHAVKIVGSKSEEVLFELIT